MTMTTTPKAPPCTFSSVIAKWVFSYSYFQPAEALFYRGITRISTKFDLQGKGQRGTNQRILSCFVFLLHWSSSFLDTAHNSSLLTMKSLTRVSMLSQSAAGFPAALLPLFPFAQVTW
jgi:hypothetical protein